jgi:hypothetical protein
VRSVLIRSGLVAMAVAVGGWLAVSIHNLDLQSRGVALTKRIQHHQAPASEAQQGLDDLRDARRLSADELPRLNTVSLLLASGRPREATAVADAIVADEPDNVAGWILVDAAARATHDTGRAQFAFRRIRQLNPLIAGAVPGTPSTGS